MSLSVLCVPHETCVMAQRCPSQHSHPPSEPARRAKPASRAGRCAPAGQTGATTAHTRIGLGCCRERHVHDTTIAANGTLGTLNDPNVPFTAEPAPRPPQL